MKILVTWDQNEDGQKRWRTFDGSAVFKVRIEDAGQHRYEVNGAVAAPASVALEGDAQGERRFKLTCAPRRFSALAVTFTAKAVEDDAGNVDLPEAHATITVVDGRLQWLALLVSAPLLLVAFVAS